MRTQYQFILIQWLSSVIVLFCFAVPVTAKDLSFVLDAPIFRKQEAELIADQLNGLGLKVTVKIWTQSALVNEIRSGKRVAYLTDWGSAYFDPFDLALPKLSTNGRGNFSFYSNRQVDKLFQQSVSESKIIKRKELLHEVQQLIFQDAPWVFGFNLSNIEASSNNILNYTPSDDNRINLRDIELVHGSVLKVGMNTDSFDTLDPAMHHSGEAETVIRNIFDALVIQKKNGEIVPELAESWEQQNEGHFLFKIRQGVRFHDGSLVTIEDVIFSFERILYSGRINGESSPRRELLGPLDSVSKAGRSQVLFKLKTPFPPFLQALVHFQIVPKHYIEKVGDAEFAKRPMGTGPFKFVQGSSRSSVIMRRFTDYFGGAPGIPPLSTAILEQAIFSPIPDPSTRVLDILKGDLHIIQAVSVDDIPLLAKNRNIKIASIPGTSSYQIELNNTRPPFNNPAIRKALNHAINWQEILDSVYSGYGKRIATCFLRSGFGYNTALQPYRYNPELAKKLITEAGYRLLSQYGAKKDQKLNQTIALAKQATSKSRPLITLKGVPKRVVVAISEGSAPFHFVNNRGKPSGMFVDLWNRWSEVTGIEVVFKPSFWNNTLQNLKQGKADIHAGLFKNAKRDAFLDYGVALYNSDTHFFFHKSILDINDLEDLIPFKIGIIKGDFTYDFILKRLPEATLAIYPDNQALFDAVEFGEIKVFVKDTPTARYHLSQRSLSQKFKFHSSQPLYFNTFYIAVKEGNTPLLSIVEGGMNLISDQEKADLQRKWMGVAETKPKEVLTIALPDNRLPFSGLDFERKPTGMFVDIWNLWSKKTGQVIEFKVGGPDQIKYWLNRKEADILAGFVPAEDMSKNLIFSEPFYKSIANLFYHVKAKSRTLELALEGPTVGIVSGSFYSSQLKKEFPDLTIKAYSDLHSMIKAALSAEIEHFVYDTPITLDTLDQLGVSGQFNHNPKPFLVNDICAGIRKEDQKLLDRINSGLHRISINDLIDIEKRWIPLTELRQFKSDGARRIKLTQREQAWLKDHKNIRLGVDPSWPPFDYLGEDGKTHKGMSADFISLLNDRLGLDMAVLPLPSWGEVIDKAKKREIDVIAGLTETDTRAQYLNFSDMYLSFSWVIITQKNFEFIGSAKDLLGKRVALVTEYAIQERLQNTYPELALTAFSSPLEGLKAVSTGKSDAFVGSLVTASYLIQKYNMTNLKVAAPTGFTNDFEQLRLGVRKDWPLLVSILNKGLASITDEEKIKIKQKWFSIRIEHGIDVDYIKTIVLRVGLVFAGILAAILFWNRRLKAEITRRQIAEENLLEARDAAEAANRFKSAFLSNMSHEIRTPMNAILGFSQVMLRNSSITEAQKKDLRTIWRSGEHLMDLINDILEMSKIEAGRINLKFESFDLSSFINDLEMMFRVRTDEKGIHLTVLNSEQLPQYVRSDQGKLRQILINLLGNAVKFTNEGGVVLRNFLSENRSSLCFEVEDSGAGIPENKMDKIFLQFEQAVEGKSAAGGTGLGLAISKKYAELMKGKIVTTSIMGKGSLFRLEIPYFEAVLQEIELKKPEKRVVSLKAGQNPVRVLIVDDQETNRNLLAKTLSDVGFVIEETINGIDAIEKSKTFKPHLILMDIVMPEMGGIEATKAIKMLPDGQDIVIFAITASVFEGEKEKILKSGASEFIPKPFREANLFQKIELHLGINFEYENRKLETENIDSTPDDAITHLGDRVQQLPKELIEQLAKAATNGYIRQLQKLIEQVDQLDAETAMHLNQLAQQYNYEKLIDLLKCDQG